MRQYQKYVMFMSIILSACHSNVNSKWSRPGTAGQSCLTIEEADKIEPNIATGTSFREVYETPDTSLPLRQGEKVSRLWMAPFIDNQNNFHEASIIHVVVDSNRWIGVKTK